MAPQITHDIRRFIIVLLPVYNATLMIIDDARMLLIDLLGNEDVGIPVSY